MPSDSQRKTAKKQRRQRRAGKKATENLAVAKLRAETNDAWFKTTGYLTGGLEQLGHQIGQVMTMQSAMLEYLDKRHVGLGGIDHELQQYISDAKAKYEAEQEQKRQEAEKVKATKEQEKASAAEAEQVQEADAQTAGSNDGEVEQKTS